MLDSVSATPAERRAPRPGDAVVPTADVVMDRAVDLAAPPSEVWPWLVQLGKGRAGWYLPRSLERVLPRGHRAARTVGAQWQQLTVGDVVPDYGGPKAYFRVAEIDAPRSLVYDSQRGRTTFSWSISLEPRGAGTRVFFRLRIAPVRRRWLANTVGAGFDAWTIAGLARGLQQRLAERAGRAP